MNRILATACVCIASALAPCAADPAPRPNIVLIVSDDMGNSDLGSYGGEIQTPHLDKPAPDHTAANLRETELMRKWWAHMAPLMETNPDQSPVRVDLTEMFHLE